MRPKWYWFPLYIWAFPPVLVGLVLALWGGWETAQWKDGVLVVGVRKIAGGDWVAGQTWSWLVLVTVTATAREPRDSLLVHEFVHVLHCLFLGVFFYLSYGVHWAFNRLVFGMDHITAYRRIWTERIAYRVQEEFQEGKRAGAWGS